MAIAMTCMAAAEFGRFAIGQIFNFLSKESESSYQFDGRLPSRLQDFSTASLLLSIGVPILHRHYPEIHVCDAKQDPLYFLVGENLQE